MREQVILLRDKCRSHIFAHFSEKYLITDSYYCFFSFLKKNNNKNKIVPIVPKLPEKWKSHIEKIIENSFMKVGQVWYYWYHKKIESISKKVDESWARNERLFSVNCFCECKNWNVIYRKMSDLRICCVVK